MKADARTKVNRLTGSKRMFSHAIFMPGHARAGWTRSITTSRVLKPDSFKGYTVGDNTNKQLSRHPWRMDDEKLLYPFYEKLVKAGLVNVCVHKGLYPAADQRSSFPNLLPYADVRDVGKAAKDWPQLNFIIYHSAFRFTGGAYKVRAWSSSSDTGRIDWVTDLAEIPAKYGVKNVYGDLGQIFAQSTVAEPRLCAAMMGQLVKGLGADHVVWGTDAVWTGAPQWQIEALRRLEIPEDMQKEARLRAAGPGERPVKNADLRRELRAAVQVRPASRADRAIGDARQSDLRARRSGPHQPALRLRRRFHGLNAEPTRDTVLGRAQYAQGSLSITIDEPRDRDAKKRTGIRRCCSLRCARKRHRRNRRRR